MSGKSEAVEVFLKRLFTRGGEETAAQASKRASAEVEKHIAELEARKAAQGVSAEEAASIEKHIGELRAGLDVIAERGVSGLSKEAIENAVRSTIVGAKESATLATGLEKLEIRTPEAAAGAGAEKAGAGGGAATGAGAGATPPPPKTAKELIEEQRLRKMTFEADLAEAQVKKVTGELNAPKPSAAAPVKVADVQALKQGLEVNKDGTINYGKYITREDKKIIRDAIKAEKTAPGGLEAAKNSVAANVAERIMQDAESFATSKEGQKLGLNWPTLKEHFGVENRLFKSVTKDVTTDGQILKTSNNSIDDDLIYKVYTEATKADYVGVRTAINIAVPPLAPFLGTTGTVKSRFNFLEADAWKRLGISLGLFAGAGTLAEFADAKRDDAAGRTSEKYDFSLQSAADKGVPFVYDDTKDYSFLKEAAEPLASGNLYSLGSNFIRAVTPVKTKEPEEPTPQLPQDGVDWNAPPSTQTNGTGIAPTNLDWNTVPDKNNGKNGRE